MSRPAENLPTWADIAGYPEGTRVEILDGEIQMAPRPAIAHGLIQASVSHFIGGPFGFEDGPGGWWIVIEPDVELATHVVLEPDVVGWRRSRVPEFPSERPVRIVPDWICEILSPSNRRQDLVTKADLYRRYGVPFYWTVDPEERVLQALHLDATKGSWEVVGTWTDGHKVAIPPFEAVTLDVTRLFPPAK